MLWFKTLLQKCNNDSVTVHLFLHLLTTSDGSGAVTTTLQKLAWELKTTVDKIRIRLKHLKDANLITTPTSNQQQTVCTPQKGTLVTICNYESYAVIDLWENQRNPIKTPPQSHNTKETKKEKVSPTPPIKEKNKEKYLTPVILTDDAPPTKTPKEIYFEIVELWHSICTDFPKLRTHSQTRQNKVRIRLTEMGGYPNAMATISEIFRKAQASSFLKGDRSGWKATFDWFFENPNNWCKVIEGAYDNINNGQRTHTTSNTDRERIIRERQEQHLRDIEKLNADYLAKIGQNTG